MPKFPLLVGTAALGLAFVAGATRTVAATEETTIPSDGINCYYHLWHCVYEDNGYWSGCDERYGEGWIPTGIAKAICREYHRQ